VGVEQGAWALYLDVRGDVPIFVSVDQARFASALWLAGLSACGVVAAFKGCGVVVAGGRFSTDDETFAEGGEMTPFGAAGVRLEAALPMSDMIVFILRADLLFPWTRTLLKVDEQAIWQTPVAMGDLGIGLRFYFP